MPLLPNMGRRQASCMLVVFVMILEVANLCVAANHSTTSCIEAERQALLHFKSTFQDPSQRLSSWNGLKCCQWKGIGCDPVTKHVVKLDLKHPWFELFSSHWPTYLFRSYEDIDWSTYDFLQLNAQNVTPSLLQLKYLNYLDLSRNDFNGTSIPTFLGSMKRLRYLSLSYAHFGGRIPHNLGNLSKLHHLDLSWNFYLYPEEDINWVSQLQSLHYLDMSYVHLGKAHNLFQVLNMLPYLSHVHLQYCQLSNLLIHDPQPINVTNLARVEVLNLAENDLEAPMLNAFQNMTSVKVLDLSYNFQLKLVPFWLREFKSLTELYLSECSLEGPFPFVLQNLTSIEILDLSYNALNGSIPDALQNMSSIFALNLGGNNFFSFPSWLGESKILHLNLASNNFTNMEVPLSSILRNMCRFKSLDLSNNMFQGEVFKGYENASTCINSNLEALYLASNDFNGSLPVWLGNLKYLKELVLDGNHLNGTIPESLGLLVNLRVLSLSSNNFDGVIPNSIKQLVNLKVLRLDFNYFHDNIPSHYFDQLVNLQRLDLSNNNFQGVIPSNFDRLVNLQRLDLSNNNFHGVITSNLDRLVNLYYLNLSNNNFHGVIQMNLGLFKSLYYLDLSNNFFHDVSPKSLVQNFENSPDELEFIFQLDLSSNSLNGTFSELIKWFQMKKISRMDLSNNHITGSLPKDIGDRNLDLYELSVANNLINGSIPNSLCRIKRLTSLDLSNNDLSGEVPNCWRDTYAWYEINLSSNRLSGVYPSSFGNLSTLSWLHLNNNSLQGELPVLMNNSQLLILDLGENRFSGSIPSWTKNTFPSLQILRLRNNMLNGSIPSSLCQLSTLQILDLANNRLSGSIPHCIGNLRGMTLNKSSDITNTTFALSPIPIEAEAPKSSWDNEDVKQVLKGREDDYTRNLMFVVNLDLSSNNLVGLIPKGITLLTGLHGLNLSYNHLKGEIPPMIGNIISLESFDVSNNQLSGSIPNSMSALCSLSHLNLSYNNLSGPIPGGNQLSTLDDQYIYVGNRYLCGPSLPKKCGPTISHQVPGSGEGDDDERKNKLEKIWFYFVVAVGFATGFWGAIGTLWYKKSWRHACFRWVEDLADDIYVEVVIRVNKINKWKGKFCVRG